MAAGHTTTVGRTHEIAELEAALNAVDAGTPSFLAIEGEPGIGKSRLLQELCERADRRGHLVLSGSAAEFERDLPFGLWVEALDDHIATQELDRDPRFDVELQRRLAPVLPSLRAPAAGTDAEAGGERYRTHRAMRVLLEVLAANRPLVVTLDDLHWADSASVELIGSLLRRGADGMVLLALAYRAGHAPARLSAALASGDLTTIRLEGLTEDESTELVGDGLSRAQRATIFTESGGNPFYMLQLARTARLPAQAAPSARVSPTAGVPDAVAAALATELEALTQNGRRLLDAGAVAGDPFEPELAFAIGQLAEDEGFVALDELLDAGLLRPTDVPRRFRFRHPLVRRAAYESSKRGWRLLAHRRAAEALAQLGASPAAQAHHVEQSAARGDAAAIALLVRAADAARAQSPAGATRWYAAALRLMSDADNDHRRTVLVELAAAQESIGDHVGSATSLLEAIDLLDPADAAARVTLTARCAASEIYAGRHDQAWARLVTVADSLPDHASREGVVLLLAQAMARFFTKHSARGCELAAQALDTARELGLAGLVGDAAATLSHLAAVQGDIQRAEQALDEAAAVLDALPDADAAEAIDAFHRLCRSELHLERFEDGLRHAERGLRLARATGQYGRVPVLLSSHAQTALMLGRLAAATESQDAAVEGARLAGNALNVCAILSTTAAIAALRGDFDTAVQAGWESVTIVGPDAAGHIVSVAKACLAVTLRERGSAAEAADDLVEPVAGWDMPLLPAVWRARHQETLTRVELASGNLAAAGRAADLAEQAARELGLPLSTALGRRARAAVALASEQPDVAAPLALDAAASAAAVGARIEAARSRLVAGEALAASGTRAEAVALLREVERELDEDGALHPRNEARRLLRKLGARVEPRGPATGTNGGLAALTKREREIAELVTDRRTNREIAAELYLSEKTIESHLRNIFVKLSASSRVDVARALERERGRVS